MGQKVGKLPEDEAALSEEIHRVLHYSAEVLARADDNVDAEDSFLLDYDDASIDAKVNKWLNGERSKYRIVKMTADRETELKACFCKLGLEVKLKMRREYDAAYVELRRFTRVVDAMAEDEKKIHRKILQLEESLPKENRKEFRKRFARLRLKVFDNLRESERLAFRDRLLKKQFVRKVHDIDRANQDLCRRRIAGYIDELHIARSSDEAYVATSSSSAAATGEGSLSGSGIIRFSPDEDSLVTS